MLGGQRVQSVPPRPRSRLHRHHLGGPIPRSPRRIGPHGIATPATAPAVMAGIVIVILTGAGTADLTGDPDGWRVGRRGEDRGSSP